MSTVHQKFSLALKGYSLEEREAIAVRVIDRIKERTQSGKDKDGAKFEKYSQAYKDSHAFKVSGKGSKVDLVLSGDMLDSIQILRNSRGEVVIGFKRGSTENGKADGNIRGTYGQDRRVGPERDFLGITRRELRAILSDFPAGESASKKEAKSTLKAVEDAGILSGKVDVENLD